MPIAQLLRPAQTLGCRRLTDASRLARKSKVSRKEVFEQFVVRANAVVASVPPPLCPR